MLLWKHERLGQCKDYIVKCLVGMKHWVHWQAVQEVASCILQDTESLNFD